MQSYTKTDQRGLHWKEKVAAGTWSKPYEHNPRWADCAIRVEAELHGLLVSVGVTDYSVPWRRVSDQNRIGNSLRVTFMQLMIHHINKVVKIEFTDGSPLGRDCDLSPDRGFMGIQRFTVVQPEIFNGSTAYGAIQSVEWVRRHLTPTHLISNIKLWNSMGLRPSAENVYAFNPDLRKRHLLFNHRLNETRSQKQKKCVAEPPTNPAASISFLLCSPDDLLRDA